MFRTSDRWSVWSVWCVWSIPTAVHDPEYICQAGQIQHIPDLYDLAHVAAWELYNLQDLGQVSWVRYEVCRSCTPPITAGYDLDCIYRDMSDFCLCFTAVMTKLLFQVVWSPKAGCGCIFKGFKLRYLDWEWGYFRGGKVVCLDARRCGQES